MKIMMIKVIYLTEAITQNVLWQLFWSFHKHKKWHYTCILHELWLTWSQYKNSEKKKKEFSKKLSFE